MRKWLVVVVAVVVAGCGGDRSGTRDGAGRNDPQALVLYPRDLQRGYEHGDDSGCGAVSAAEGEWPKLESLFADERPNACIAELVWVWAGEAPYSNEVTSAAYVFGNAAGAQQAFEARDELAAWTASIDVDERETLDLGEEAELVRGDGLNDPASGVVWRDGNVVAVLVVEPTKDDAARELARRQQQRIEHPSRPSAKDVEEDPQLQLDDPTLQLPVYWLGSTFDPPGDLPQLELESATVGGNGPGQSVQLWYSDGVTLDTWEPDAWERFRRTRLGRLIWDSPCARKTVVRVEGGRAEVFEGYGDPFPVERPCPRHPPDQVITHVYYDRVVVAVNMPYCYTCANRESRRNPYETVTAMETLVRSLRLRPARH